MIDDDEIATEGEVPDSYRPALVKLTSDLEEMSEEMMDGFSSRADVLDWMQRLTVRTLGELPQRWYHELARQFRGCPASGKERTLLGAMLVPAARQRDLDEDTARELRSRVIALTIKPAYHRAYRRLRKDAGEYVDEENGTVSGHSPHVQRYIAMRPAIDELERYQRDAMTAVLEGFDDREEILDWGSEVELATHGEIGSAFVARCYREESTASMLTSGRAVDKRARELFVAHHLIPQYNRGVRDLAGRAKEQPDAEKQERETPMA